MFKKHLVGLVALSSLSVPVFAAEYQSLEERLGYTMGYKYGEIVKSQGVSIDTAAFSRALNDVLQGKAVGMTEEEMNNAMREANRLLMEAKKKEAAAALEKGKQFLETNKGKEGVVTQPSGLQYKVLIAGEGSSPQPSDRVTINYEGTLINGEVFDSSYRRGEPASFPVGGVIPGFREALTLMKPGATWQVFVPSELGYGASGAPGSIGPNEVLIFKLELISIAAAPSKSE